MARMNDAGHSIGLKVDETCDEPIFKQLVDQVAHTRGEVVDLRIQQRQKHSRLCNVGVFVCGRHARYEVTSDESFSFAMRSTSRGTKSRIRCPAK